MAYFAYNVGGWVQKEGKMCLRNKSMAPKLDWKMNLDCVIDTMLRFLGINRAYST